MARNTSTFPAPLLLHSLSPVSPRSVLLCPPLLVCPVFSLSLCLPLVSLFRPLFFLPACSCLPLSRFALLWRRAGALFAPHPLRLALPSFQIAIPLLSPPFHLPPSSFVHSSALSLPCRRFSRRFCWSFFPDPPFALPLFLPVLTLPHTLCRFRSLCRWHVQPSPRAPRS